MFARLIFALVQFGARKGLSEAPAEDSSRASVASPKENARRTGIRGETYAYWYLRRHGYTLVARNYTFPGFKGEIDMAGYDGSVLAFVEVKTRTIAEPLPGGWRLSFRDAGPCPVCGDMCKRRSLPEGHPLVYAGDGVSDRCAARAADRVFARGWLADDLGSSGLPHERFETLADVAAALS